MDVKKRCLDTYALVEIAKGNSIFAQHLQQDIIITEITLAEFYGVILREEGEKMAEQWFQKLNSYSQPVDMKTFIEAVKFRYEHKKKNISFFDAVGYIFSIRNNLNFVTGDKEFEHFKQVEFKK